MKEYIIHMVILSMSQMKVESHIRFCIEVSVQCLMQNIQLSVYVVPRLGNSLHTLESLLNHVLHADACDFLVFVLVLQDMRLLIHINSWKQTMRFIV